MARYLPALFERVRIDGSKTGTVVSAGDEESRVMMDDPDCRTITVDNGRLSSASEAAAKASGDGDGAAESARLRGLVLKLTAHIGSAAPWSWSSGADAYTRNEASKWMDGARKLLKEASEAVGPKVGPSPKTPRND
jgi:hypothetical protein